MSNLNIAFTEHAHRAQLRGEKEGAVCSFCGAQLPHDYYLLLSAWRSQTQELVSPAMRFCDNCWQHIENILSHEVRQLKVL